MIRGRPRVHVQPEAQGGGADAEMAVLPGHGQIADIFETDAPDQGRPADERAGPQPADLVDAGLLQHLEKRRGLLRLLRPVRPCRAARPHHAVLVRLPHLGHRRAVLPPLRPEDATDDVLVRLQEMDQRIRVHEQIRVDEPDIIVASVDRRPDDPVLHPAHSLHVVLGPIVGGIVDDVAHVLFAFADRHVRLRRLESPQNRRRFRKLVVIDEMVVHLAIFRLSDVLHGIEEHPQNFGLLLHRTGNQDLHGRTAPFPRGPDPRYRIRTIVSAAPAPSNRLVVRSGPKILTESWLPETSGTMTVLA